MAVTPHRTTIELVRTQFPALASGFAFFENAGGSQVPAQVLERMRDLMLRGYVQTGAGYPASDIVDKTVAESKRYANVLMNGGDTGLTVIGPSTTDLLYRLSNSLAHTIKPGDEIVIGVTNHESNIGPWLRLKSAGAVIKWWGVDQETGEYSYDELTELLSENTKIVAVAHTSNLLGDILDVKRVTAMAHAIGAIVVVDGVAFAPHEAVDVQALGADFYVLSLYKVYGPHIALLFGTHEAWSNVKGPNHFFIKEGDLPWKFELGCQPYEALAGLLGVGDYLSLVAGNPLPIHDRPTIEAAYGVFKDLERPVQERIVEYLLSKPQVRFVGPRSSDKSRRHPTVSFIHREKPSDQFVRHVNGDRIGIRYGHMYAARLCEALGAPLDTGFVRISAVHYNTTDEADRLIAALEVAI
ncbi:MAG: aminotransferase class V-fold PLP-dependent enzyme [Trueperaceae bacterium]